jgi:hypothetical protein
MTTNFENLLFELALFILLGILYYFYQKKKIIAYEEKRPHLVLEQILISCLAEKRHEFPKEQDQLIESLDDYLHNRTMTPPYDLMKAFMNSEECSPELKQTIHEGLLEIEKHHAKE